MSETEPKDHLQLVACNPDLVVTSKPDQKPNLYILSDEEEVTPKLVTQERPLSQVLWENRVDLLSAANLFVIAVGVGVIFSDLPPVHTGLTKLGINLILTGAALQAGTEIVCRMKEPVQKVLSTVQQWWEGDRYL